MNNSGIPFEKKIRAFVSEKGLLKAGDHVCVSFSGGADSLCLLVVLECMRAEIGFHLSAMHVNHHLRGRESDEDEAFVRAFCGKQNIPLRVFHCRADEAAGKLHCSSEEAGRALRQEAWRRCAASAKGMKIAVAHHRNDQAETVLFRAARGTSLAGLGGIRAVQRLDPCAPARRKLLAGMITEDTEDTEDSENTGRHRSLPADGAAASLVLIRPLLCAGRGEIEEWLKTRHLSWQTDRTNLENTYARNIIRNQLLPGMEERINTDTVRHLAELAEDAEEADGFLRAEALLRAEKYLIAAHTPEDGCVCIDDAVREEPPVMQKYILMEALRRAAGSVRDLGREQLRQLMQLSGMPSGKAADLPYGICAVKEYGGIRLYRKKTEDAGEREPVREILLPELSPASGVDGKMSFTFELGDWHFDVTVRDRSECPEAIPEKKYTKWLDYDKINKCLAVRFREKGDWMTTLADGGRKKLKDILIDSKIPRQQRDRIPLLASGSEIFWITGGRISERAKVRPDTRTVFEITALCAGRGQEMADERNDQGFGGRGTHCGTDPGAGRADQQGF